MNEPVGVLKVFREFAFQFPREFIFLFGLLILEGLATFISVLSVIPLAEYVVYRNPSHTSKITHILLVLGSHVGIGHPSLLFFGSFFVVTNFVKGIFEVFIRFAIIKLKHSIILNLLERALNTFFNARWGFFSDLKHGDLLNTFTKGIANIGETIGNLATMFAQVVQLGIYLALPFWINPKMTAVAIGLSIVFGIPFFLLRKLSYRLGKSLADTSNEAYGVIGENLKGARLILGLGRQKQAVSHALMIFKQHTDAELHSSTLSIAVPKSYAPMVMLAVVISIGIALQQNTPVPEVGGILWSLLGTMPILAGMLQTNVSVAGFMPSYEQFLALCQNASDWKEVQGEIAFERLREGIELQHVTFTYPERNKTLNNISMYVKKGQMTALVGKSGSGKSTITDIILGLQIPESGHVLFDKIDLSKWNQNSIRRKVGYVPQDPILFHSSIRDNLLWVKDSATEMELWKALELANASQVVRDLPHGIDTIVGDRGMRLSGGQRQRIVLARALLLTPELLILDEATSSLDSESERLIQHSIEQIAKNTTILIIAHRLSTVAKSDYLYVLENGQIIENGVFSDLMKKEKGPLKTLVNAQEL